MYKDDEGLFVVHPRHLLQSEDGSPKLLKSTEVGFALAEYSNGDNVDPRVPFADQCTISSCKEKPAKLLPPLPLANAASPPLPKPTPLQKHAAKNVRDLGIGYCIVPS